MSVDFTHAAEAQSWLASANSADCPFPVQNLPWGRWRRDGRLHCGVALGDRALELTSLYGVLPVEGLESGNLLFLADPQIRQQLRHWIFQQCVDPSADLCRRTDCWTPLAEIELQLPFEVGDYTDFYASIDHARRVGSMFRPEQPLLPNYQWVPIGYHGRASSLVVSGSPIRRPNGQRQKGTDAPGFGPTQMLDYELEVGFFLGPGNSIGQPVGIAQAGQHWMGLCLVNDWSARDVQRWEYQPLGPFLAKSFATSVSPWVVTPEALEPFRRAAAARPRSLDYLWDDQDQTEGALGLELEVWLRTPAMDQPTLLSKSQFADLFWTPAQLIAHHSSNGCPLRPGDLIASGTVSGAAADSAGCLLELTWQGAGQERKPVQLPSGEKRLFLEDGDEVCLRGWARRDGFRSIGLGECCGTVQAALDAG